MSISNLSEKIEELLQNDIVDRHSYFQLKYFVIGKEPTHQARLWRCLRELKNRKKSKENIILEIENISDRIELAELDAEDITNQTKKDEIKKRMLKRKAISLGKSLNNLEKKLKSVEEEMEFFYQAYLNLEKKEGLKPFDDFNSQLEYWNEKLSQELNLKILLKQAPSTELIDTILSLDDKAIVKEEVLALIGKMQDKLESNVKNIESK